MKTIHRWLLGCALVPALAAMASAAPHITASYFEGYLGDNNPGGVFLACAYSAGPSGGTNVYCSASNGVTTKGCSFHDPAIWGDPNYSTVSAQAGVANIGFARSQFTSAVRSLNENSHIRVWFHGGQCTLIEVTNTTYGPRR